MVLFSLPVIVFVLFPTVTPPGSKLDPTLAFLSGLRSTWT
jgi:hypothetical protein